MLVQRDRAMVAIIQIFMMVSERRLCYENGVEWQFKVIQGH